MTDPASQELLARLALEEGGRILLFVMDGVGGLPHPDTGHSELEAAETPVLDGLAAGGALGLHDPVAPGITPGSGPGHLALFGCDNRIHAIGRGALAAAGVGHEQQPDEVCARLNFCTLDGERRITDRRAGRIDSDECRRLTDLLNDGVSVEGARVTVLPVKEHRGCLVLDAPGLSDRVADMDPQATGVPPLEARPLDVADATPDDDERAARTCELVNAFTEQAERVLADADSPARGVLLRGFAGRPDLPDLPSIHRMTMAAVAAYPMYRGVARLCGMEVRDADGGTPEACARTAAADDADFVFCHVKPTDSRGEDGDFEAKVAAVEEADRALGILVEEGGYDVICVTGDHSTPARLAAHSWHPVPFLLHGETVRRDRAVRFTEPEAAAGGLGRLPGRALMALMLGHAGRLAKFGA